MKKTYESPVIRIVRMSPFEVICMSGENELRRGEANDSEVYQDEDGYWQRIRRYGEGAVPPNAQFGRARVIRCRLAA